MDKKEITPSRKSEKTRSFEVAPPSIPVSKIKETLDTDIVVAGAGVSGLPAAVSAAEKGAKTVLLEKFHRTAAPGLMGAFIGSKLQKKLGIEINKEDIIRKLLAYSEGRANERLIRKFADTNTEVIDWLIDLADAAGVSVHVSGTGHVFSKSKPGEPVSAKKDEQVMLQMLTDEALRRGVDIRYSTPAVRLIRRGNKGRVSGIIAQNAKDSYIQFNVSKAVILCTGDYGNDPEMMEKYCPWSAHIPKLSLETQTGDGQKMSLWIGADIEDAPHCTIVHFNSTNEKPVIHYRPVRTYRGNFLYVNKLGKRFANEDMPMEWFANMVLRQPDKTCWQVFDEKTVTDDNCAAIQKAITTGAVLSADTIEALAPKFGANSNTFKSTVARYNELVLSGKDLDFGKNPNMMKNTIDKPQFYVCESPPDLLATVGGLNINTYGQVLDTNLNVIPGLYAAGNITSGFFGDTYPGLALSGIARSHAITFGRIAGLHAAMSA